MKKLLVSALLFACVSGQTTATEIYRSIDDDGNVLYTDRPRPGAERIRIEQEAAPKARVRVPQPQPVLDAQPLVATEGAGESNVSPLPSKKRAVVGIEGKAGSETKGLGGQRSRTAAKSRTEGSSLPAAADGAIAGYRSLRIIKPGNDDKVIDASGSLPVEVAFVPAVQAAGHKLKVFIDGKVVRELPPRGRFVLSGVPQGTHNIQAALLDGESNVLILATPVTFHLSTASRQSHQSAVPQR